MTKADFLQELQDGLSGEVSPQIIQESVNYYSRYIDEALASGQSEQQIFDTLGPARLIAKTIIDANSSRKEPREEVHPTQNSKEERKFTFHSWYGRLLLILLAILVVALIIALVVGVAMAVWYLLPVIAVIVIIIVLVRLFIGRRND